MTRVRLDKALVEQGLAATRSQAENYIRLGKVQVDKKLVSKPGFLVSDSSKIDLDLPASERYVSRAALKLAGAVEQFKLSFKDKLVLDVGSSTGGFTDYALKHGAKKVVAVDVGSEQMHPSLRTNPRLELHEKTDIRDFKMTEEPDIVVADLSFISLRQILPSIGSLSGPGSQILVLLKPQFEAGKDQINRGIVKNERLRRDIIKDFETWTKPRFLQVAKIDSQVAGTHGNHERFYLLKKLG